MASKNDETKQEIVIDGRDHGDTSPPSPSPTPTPSLSSEVWTTKEFEDWFARELNKDPLSTKFKELFAQIPKCIGKWRERFHGDPVLWKRLFCKDRVLKEVIEAIPIIHVVHQYVQAYSAKENNNENKKLIIVDLASGRGYLSMILSELLDPTKVQKLVLIDKAWSQRNMEPQSHHIKWDHIYGQIPATASATATPITEPKSYYDTWPIPLETSKQDLKHTNQRQKLQQRFFSSSSNNNNNSPVILLAVHLCGTLSLKAVEFYNCNATIQLFCLKPCCLPGMIHAKRNEIFTLGNNFNKNSYSFPAKQVCMQGKWKKNKWHGPLRTNLQSNFNTWSVHLYRGINSSDNTTPQVQESQQHQQQESNDNDMKSINDQKIQCTIPVQHDGGYQNEFLFAERLPILCPQIWDQLKQYESVVTCHEINTTS